MAEAVIVALQTGQDQIRLFLSNRSGEGLRRSQRIELGKIVVHNVNAAVRAFRECFFDRLLHALRAHGKRDDFATVLFLEPQGLFERVAVRLVHFETDVGFLDPVSGDCQRRVFRRNLLDTHDDVHEIVPSSSA